jgi:hypothetical protein
MVFFRGRGRAQRDPPTKNFSNESQTSQTAFIAAQDRQYAIEKAGNNSNTSYQEVSGAPVETKSTLGYNAGYVTVVFLNISKM